VDRDGGHQFQFEIEVEGLPHPSELGPYDRYVAWITPPNLSPLVRLGTLDGDRTRLDVAGFNTYLVHVSAEGPGDHVEREGPLVLRGSSASMVLRPHDLPVILAEMTPGGEEPGGEGAHHHHPPADRDRDFPAETDRDPPAPGGQDRGHGMGHGVGADDLLQGDLERWRPPAMHPHVSMPHEIMRLRPQVSPFLPTGFADDMQGEIPVASPPRPIHLAHGDTLILEAGPVVRRVGHLEIPGYGFNGQSPGPLIQAPAGSSVHVVFRNATPLPSAVHWHGLRLDWRFDGVPGVTQDPVPPGASFHYELDFPDEGTFWYHPHLREDVMQDMGMAGNIRVHIPENDPTRHDVDQEEFLILDDHLVGPDGPVPYGREAPIHALMGRFGNVLLVNGSTEWEMEARSGESVRLHLTNASAARTFNLSAGEKPLRLVGGDIGPLPEPILTESVVLAPAERWTVELEVQGPGPIYLENRVQALDHMGARFISRVDTVGTIRVGDEASDASLRQGVGEGTNGERGDRESGVRERGITEAGRALVSSESGSRARPGGSFTALERVQRTHLDREPDRTLIMDLRVGRLPFPLDPLLSWEATFRPPVEWESTMPDMDWLVSADAVEWMLRDPDSGQENMEIDWRFQVGDRVKLRLVNNRDNLHPMQHPIHLHGQRFLVLSVDGVPMQYPTWKDTVMVPVGSVVDILIEMDNPGPWMIHCHISEHLESGMMAVIQVDPA
jgi:suppressor of ftsI